MMECWERAQAEEEGEDQEVGRGRFQLEGQRAEEDGDDVVDQE